MKHSPTTAEKKTSWTLEVVRGRDIGRVFALESGETLVGNALLDEPGLDLVEQEGNSPRRMAGRHAALSSTGSELSIRDLESPGGTFVNRQRLLSGQTRRLEPGDVIQLGSVQLRVTRAGIGPAPALAPAVPPAFAAVRNEPPGAAAAPPVTAIAGRLPIPFTMAGGATCKTWDDFLVLAAQRWAAVRDELSSGRIADHLRRIGRADLVPRWEKGNSPDEQLDEWLGRLPATRASAPELDVHPQALNVRALAGGGTTYQTLRVANVGYRLLKSTARVEPLGTPWLRLRPEHDGRPFSTIDEMDLPVELEIPETLARPLSASIVIESNGGKKQIPVRVEQPAEQVVIPPAAPGGSSEVSSWGTTLGERLARVRPATRVLACAVSVLSLRLTVALVSVLPIGAQGARALQPRLAAIAIVLAALGALAGTTLARKRGEGRDLAAAGCTGAALGLLTAALCHATIESVERVLGTWSTSIWAVALLWGTIGALAGLVTTLLVPHRGDEPEVAR